MMKFTKFKYPILVSTLFCSSVASAQKVDESRAIALSNAVIQFYANAHVSKPDAHTKMVSLIEGVSESEVRKNNQAEIQSYTSPADTIFAELKQEFSPEEFQQLKPAFERQFKTQNAFYQSCKISGKVTEQQNDVLVPLNCQVPELSLEDVDVPERLSKDSDAQYLTRSISAITNALEKAPRKAFSTQILIHLQDNLYIPEMDDARYFPNSITQQMSGSTDAESEILLTDEEDAAP